eukprot:CAMPEP_0184551990 /NCGR_PEP_ID=MMETSP0199_2-20130426/27351_1 /TAXON_ID=1112570 /ORGANISM="Thraustochytrium sp., Strain LLF1b" /LENGTH=53 /DNA_ID=CAMNT_0026947341 /DNA_START=1 /DNA_END=158 /DNA_ORIENTATION=+
MPQARRLMRAYREVVFRVFDPMGRNPVKTNMGWVQHLHSRFVAGLLSDDIPQR